MTPGHNPRTGRRGVRPFIMSTDPRGRTSRRGTAGPGRGGGMARPQYIVGIDLGTTNCAVAYVDTRGRERPTADIRMFEVPQLVAPGETAPRTMLPSFLYLAGGPELPPGAARLPWGDENDRIIGEFAR